MCKGALEPRDGSPQGARHATVVRRLNMLLAPALVGRAEVQVQSPFAASDDSEPEPDVAVIPAGDYLRDHPSRAMLVIEVADSSLRKDRQIKPRLYAAAGVPEYWIVDLESDAAHVHRDPYEGGYGRVTRQVHGDMLSLLAFPDVSVPASDLLPPR
jgi:Uma2 family endonuclease